MDGERFYSKTQTRKILGLGRIRYQQVIEAGLLPAPIKLTGEARPVHTASQIERFKRNLFEEASRPLAQGRRARRKTKPLSGKLAAEIR